MQLSSFENKFSLDSLKLRIPASKVQVLVKNLETKLLLIDDESGEVVDEIKEQGYKIKEKGVTTRYLRGFVNITWDKKEEYIIILLNSKLLKSPDYFKGINHETVSDLYNNIIDQGVIYVGYDDFLTAHCVDVDFKEDWICTPPNAVGIIEYLKSATKVNTKFGSGWIPFGAPYKSGYGVQWSNRKTANVKFPYVKIYDKTHELLKKSVEFTNEYLVDHNKRHVVPINLRRCEYTIKNRKHFRSLFGSEFDPTLENILTLTQRQLRWAQFKILSRHIEQIRVPDLDKTQNKNLTPCKQVILNLIALCAYQTAMTEEMIIDLAMKHVGSNGKDSASEKVIRSRTNTMLKDLIKRQKGKDSAFEIKLYENSYGYQWFSKLKKTDGSRDQKQYEYIKTKLDETRSWTSLIGFDNVLDKTL